MKLNFLANFNEETINAITTAVQYEANLMLQTMNDEAIAKQDKIIANQKGGYSEDEIKVAKDKKSKLEETNAELVIANAELEPRYKSTLEVVTSANNGHVSNDLVAFRNILRLVACSDNSKFFRYAIITDVDFSTFYDLFEKCHSIDGDFDDNGMRVYLNQAWNTHKDIKAEIEKILKKMFSLVADSDLTKKVTIRFNKTDLGILHECYVTGLTVSAKKDKNGEVVVGDYKFRTVITRKKDKDGNDKFEGDKFKELIAKIAFGKLYA